MISDSKTLTGISVVLTVLLHTITPTREQITMYSLFTQLPLCTSMP